MQRANPARAFRSSADTARRSATAVFHMHRYLAERGRPHFVCVPASKIWTPTEHQTIPPLAVAKIG
jgi:hypothetical protein